MADDRTLIELRAVTFAYHGRPPVLRDFGFALSQGQRVGLTGPNGCGKTTLLHLMVGLLRPQSGTVWAFGAPRRREADFTEVRRMAGLVFQDSDDQLFCPTVLEDVAFGPLNLGLSAREAIDAAKQTLADLGLGGFEDRVTYKLSGGEKRLVALATVLAMRPRVLLLDEPAAGLDGGTSQRLTGVLASLPQAMVIVSHEPRLLEALATDRLHLAAAE